MKTNALKIFNSDNANKTKFVTSPKWLGLANAIASAVAFIGCIMLIGYVGFIIMMKYIVMQHPVMETLLILLSGMVLYVVPGIVIGVVLLPMELYSLIKHKRDDVIDITTVKIILATLAVLLLVFG